MDLVWVCILSVIIIGLKRAHVPVIVLEAQWCIVAVVVPWLVISDVVEAPDEGLVKDGFWRDVAGTTLVQGKALILPALLSELPPGDEGEVFCGLSGVSREIPRSN
jgi:hypothetical protein